MTSRQAAILRAVVREYIRTGEPLGSVQLAERAEFPWSSATIRAECADLEEEGFLSSPHTSAGRIPTTSGYRYYVDHWIERTPNRNASAQLRRVTARDPIADLHFARVLAHALAHLSGTLAVVALRETAAQEAGLGYLLRMREFVEAQAGEDLERLLNAIVDAPAVFDDLSHEGPAVFIDGENPAVESARMSMVVTSPRSRSGHTIVAALIGPVRMPYNRYWRILRAFEQTVGHSLPSL